MRTPRSRRHRLTWLAASALLAPLVVAPSAGAAAPSSQEYVVLLAAPATDSFVDQHDLDVEAATTGAIDSVTASLSAAEVRQLADDPKVLGVAANAVVTASADVVPPAVQRVGATEAPVRAGTSTDLPQGAVAVLDTGVDEHQDYRRVGGTDCIGTSGYISDANGHGTGVAGMVAAEKNGLGIVGSAPGAAVYSVRILDGKLKGDLASLVCGLNWVATNAQALDIRVANLSLGLTGRDDDDCGVASGDVLHQAVCAVVGAGVVPVAAAGNQATDLGTQVPAAYDEVLAVTNAVDFDGVPGGLATTKPCSSPNEDDTAARASNYAVSADDAAHTVAAPGECPLTTKKGNRVGYIQSGTSMSAAVASGVVLDCLQAGQPCAGQSPAQAIRTVVAQARAAGPDHGYAGDPSSPVAGQYRGYLVNAAFGAATEPDPTPTTPAPTPTTPTVPRADPASIAGLVQWARADDITTTDGGSVTRWPSRVSGGADLVQSTASSAPVLRATGLGGRPAVEVSGNRFMTTGTLDWPAQGYTLWAVASRTRTGAVGVLAADGNSTGTRATRLGFSDANAAYFANRSTGGVFRNDLSGRATTSGTPVVLTGISTATGAEAFLDGVSDGVTTGGGETLATSRALSLGRFYSGGGGLTGQVAEWGVYDHALSADERSALHSYLSDRYGIPVADYAAPTATTPTPTATADTTRPTATVVAPADRSTATGTMVLRATASDDTAVTAVRFYAGSTLLGSGVRELDEWVLAVDTRNYPNATYGFVAKAYDAAGNVGTSAMRYVTVQNSGAVPGARDARLVP